jgi:hypothetical protein
VPQTCTPGTPTAETCNGIDDDCDGVTDENLGTTTCGVGACRRTVDNCHAGVPQSCTPGTPAPDDGTCNLVDDDCDGSVDEDYISVPTTCGVGACQANGSTSCVNGTVVDSCQAGSPSEEICSDLIDNDCDGEVDEGCPAKAPGEISRAESISSHRDQFERRKDFADFRPVHSSNQHPSWMMLPAQG